MTESFFNSLTAGAKEMEIAISEAAALKMYDFYKSVVDYNEKVNLTAVTEESEFIIKHLLDSVSAAPLIPENAKICDLGAGAGFPSIPLKILRPDLKFTLLDALKKRINFVNEEVSRLGLSNIAAVHMRAEDAGRGKYRESFDVVAARAVSSTSTLLEYAAPLLKTGGIFISYKGPDLSDIDAAKSALKALNCSLIKLKSLELPMAGGQRNLAVFKKLSPTAAKYPRHTAKILKNPL